MRIIKTAICMAFPLLCSLIALAQKSTITGKITDAGSGAGVAGAVVKVKATNATTTTKPDGSFSIEATPADVLEVSSLGYASLDVNVDNRTDIAVSLTASIQDLGQVVLIGTRSTGRIKTETAVPVDVISLKDIGQTSARPDLTTLLNYSAPSFNYNKQSGSDGADAIDLATLRGLGPDQTLVLINGKRRHQTAFVAIFGTRGRGNSGTDLNAIPDAAIDRVEILRDGASAQYGSDAIAGVMNIILKKDVKHLTINAGWSGYDDHKYNALNNIMPNQYYTGSQIDGNTGKIAVNYGVPVGKKDGFINFSGNFLIQGKTFRQVPDTNYTTNPGALPVNNVRRANGDASVTSGGAMFNMEAPLKNKSTVFYAFGGGNYKQSGAYAYTRNFSGHPERFPTDANGNLIYVPSIMRLVDPSAPVQTDPALITAEDDVYFNPIQNVHITDLSLAAGIRGKLKCGWNWDVSNTIGSNNFHYFVDNTFNASLGADKTHFDAGGFSFLQNTTNVDFSKYISSVAEGMNIGAGAEFRYEKYSIFSGEEASYANYDTLKATGSQGFPGFQPADAVDANRNVVAGYGDVEIDVTKKWLVDGAFRLENYSDFGFVNTYKFATRYKVADNFNVRGSISTGFRAPSLQQINFSNTFTNVQGQLITQVKLAPNNSPITKAAGIPKLKQEKSVNASLGFSWKPIKQLTVTVDGYWVKITDRVVLSGSFPNDNTLAPALADALTAANVTNAQFFANAVNTTNKGLDIVIDYTKKMRHKQSLKVLLAGNIQNMTIDKINIPQTLNDSYVHRELFFSDREQAFVLASAPPQKFSLSVEYNINKLGIGAHLTYFGEVKLLGYGYSGDDALAGTGQPGDPNLEALGIAPMVNLDATGQLVPEQFIYSGKTVTDVYATYKITPKISVYAGVDNLFNVHPDLGITKGANGSAFDGETGGPWDPVQMGFNGMRLFTKFSFNF
ncbi:TonB-dependent receptor plug domain-containing protein [Ferruginibacter albus]|uniref:TonB-dependent receptor plug domain-containing protein n=1 Tax=Ferruginibacter albus TaxID=2875540 RepID=UPI001CC5E7EE|nr:TonB-dependent receptor [Ferruginibacter albus]UAY53160.1 TonB-dependent receptor [Ferruginibacter albus]